MRLLENKAFRNLVILLVLAVFVVCGYMLADRARPVADAKTKPLIEVVKDWGKEPFLSGLSSPIKVFCPVCQEKGMTSLVYVGGTSGTLLYSQPYYDEEGKYHYDDPNTYTTDYSCSIGHEWCESRCGEASWINITKDTEGGTLIIPEEEGELYFEWEEAEADDDNLLILTPPTSLTFGENGKYGKLSWEEGILDFEGNAFQSAKTFFLYVLKPMVDEYIEYELEKEKELTIEEPLQILFEFTTTGEWKSSFKPSIFIKVTDTDLSKCLINDRLRLDLNGEIYWIRLYPDEWKPPIDVIW